MGISLNPATLLNGQGINVSSLVQQVLSETDGQLTEWQSEQSTLQSQASDLTSINSDLTNLATAVQALADPLGALTSLTASSSDTSVLNATASTSATAGTNSVVVSNLATAGTVYTDDFSGGADASILPSGQTTGEIDLQVGGSSGTTDPITITAGSNDTLNTLASYINSQNLGVTASVVTDANGSRLALVSQSTGTPSALAITANNTNLNFDSPTGGTNASLSINGVPYSSTSNTITGAIPGVTLNLAAANPNEAVQVTVGTDSSAITSAINNFVSAYNQVIGDINQEVTINPTTNTQGPLGTDSSLTELQSSLLADAAYSPPGTSSSGYVNLAALGINTNDDGTLTVDSSQLASELSSNPAAVQSFFQNTSNSGFANNFNTDITNQTNPTTGPLNVDLAQNTASQQDLSTNISNFETQLTAQQTQLTSEFDQVNASLEAYPLLLEQVTETLGTLNTSGNTNTTSTSIPTLTSGL
ncbi:MAG TPA: flagellar filament capping protein FliD [Terriglobales bacterium]|nr:flagellar filament capping protein FliD [Terriglobales bacterium]